MNSEKFAILMLFIITYCSNSIAACLNINSERIYQGKIVAEDQKNPTYGYYISTFAEKKIIIGEYH